MRFIIVAILLFIGVVESIRHRKLTAAGAAAGGIIGFCIFMAAGWTGIAMLALFFVSGTGATSWKRGQKTAIKMEQEKAGRRTLGQVIANGGVAGLLGLSTLFFPAEKALATLMMAGAFSSAIADTLSSELGSLYGKSFYNILTLKREQRGLDGVISLEGLLIGLLGSSAMATVYGIGYGWSLAAAWIVVAGAAGNLLDSVLGASLERKGAITNNVVNFSNTLFAALLMLAFR